MRKFILAIMSLVLVGTAMGQTMKKVPARYTSPASGQEMYKDYCASCHGVDGKGNGPAAPALKVALPDLTQLSKKNDGKFPENRVAQVIQGDSRMASHGSKDMPIWGQTFLSIDQHDHAMMSLRVKNLTDYIEKIQQK